MHEQPGGANSYTESIRAHTKYGIGWQDSPYTHGQPNNSSIATKQKKYTRLIELIRTNINEMEQHKWSVEFT